MTKRLQDQRGKKAHPESHKPKDQKTKMLLSAQTALILGGVAFGIAGVIVSLGHKIPSIWIAFTGIIFSALSGALYLHSGAIPPPKDATPKPTKSKTMTQPIQNNTITTTGQTGGFTGINTGTVHLKDPKDDARLAGLESEVAARAAKAKADEEAKAKKAEEERPTTLFQDGKPVGRALSFTIDESAHVARFSEITNSNNLNVEQPFEYRDVLLRLVHSDLVALRSINGYGVDEGKTFRGVTCEIVRRGK